jgi:hypothetical protein
MHLLLTFPVAASRLQSGRTCDCCCSFFSAIAALKAVVSATERCVLLLLLHGAVIPRDIQDGNRHSVADHHLLLLLLLLALVCCCMQPCRQMRLLAKERGVQLLLPLDAVVARSLDDDCGCCTVPLTVDCCSPESPCVPKGELYTRLHIHAQHPSAHVFVVIAGPFLILPKQQEIIHNDASTHS